MSLATRHAARKLRKRLAVCMIALLALGCTSARGTNSVTSDPSALPALLEPNYFDRLLSTDSSQNFSRGQLVRWTRMPITVYLDVPATPVFGLTESHRQAVLDAMANWNLMGHGLLAMQPTNDAQGADISVSWVSSFQHDVVGFSSFTSKNSKDLRVLVRLPLHYSDGRTIPKGPTRRIAVHELGHALGLWAHSDRETDIMFQAIESDNAIISVRDVNTLRDLYQASPNTTRAE